MAEAEESRFIEDVLLLFPPLTEARLFPYGSLPSLYAFLKGKGHRTFQFDLNIVLFHELLVAKYIKRYLRQLPTGVQSLSIEYRRVYANHCLSHIEDLRKKVFGRLQAKPNVDSTNEIRLLRQLFDLLTEQSPLLETQKSIEGLFTQANGVRNLCDDDALIVLKRLFRETLYKTRPRLLAVSVPFFSQFLPSLVLAKWCREFSPNTKVILGGPQIMLWKDELANCEGLFESIDYLGIGKGEGTLDALLRFLNGEGRICDVPDLLHPKQRELRLSPSFGQPAFSSLPAPDFSGLPVHRYISGETQYGLTTCIGCYWGRCAFCSYGRRSFDKKQYEQATPTVLADWIEKIVEQYQAHRVNFVDENTNLKLIVAAMNILEKRGIKIQFSTRNRLERILVQRDFCEELASYGCVLMSCGYETNSQRLLDLLEKGVEAKHYQKIVDNLHDAGITLRLSVMGGILDENEDEFDESLRFLKLNERKIGIDILQNLVVEPGTPLAEKPATFGIEVSKASSFQNNSILNYAGGRYGYNSSLGSISVQNMISVYKEVSPRKNDELPPPDAVNRKQNDPSVYLKAVVLHPWVKVVLTKTEGNYLVDLLWQRFFRMSETTGIVEQSNLGIFSEEYTSRKTLQELVSADLGRSC